MVIANMLSGETRSFDLRRQDQLDALTDLLGAGQVTAVSLHHKGIQHSLPLPRRFRRPVLGAEPIFNGTKLPIGERVYAQADDVRVSLSATFNSNHIRCDLIRIGKMRYRPSRPGNGGGK